MTELSGKPAGLAGASVDPAVPPPAADGFAARPVPLEANASGGMLRFAAVILGLTGVWQAVEGVVALANPAFFASKTATRPLHLGYSTWGWVHLVVGVVAIACCFGVLAGNALACVVAVVLAVVSAAVHLVFITAEPGAAILVIALDVVVILGVTTAQSRGPVAG
jgi:hypothetical protein